MYYIYNDEDPPLIHCEVTGIPPPTITWDTNISSTTTSEIESNLVRSTLLVNYDPELNGEHICTALNIAGTASYRYQLEFLGSKKNFMYWFQIIGPILAILILLFVSFILWKNLYLAKVKNFTFDLVSYFNQASIK